ncbi:hypothetical protein FA13DRAFT_1424578 [Coprinellus micaceus]|uniref:Uncharacterized protein n=1 Tax=Coprinellus micaceus TaxID=71717 RepID=A0A4Y7TN08_COPMI|nr:hypothetical protein FA13DRAFT_1424578 [Coprinellus micaceus]
MMSESYNVRLEEHGWMVVRYGDKNPAFPLVVPRIIHRLTRPGKRKGQQIEGNISRSVTLYAVAGCSELEHRIQVGRGRRSDLTLSLSCVAKV